MDIFQEAIAETEQWIEVMRAETHSSRGVDDRAAEIAWAEDRIEGLRVERAEFLAAMRARGVYDFDD